ncbi:MAG: NAD(P)-binding protein [Rhizomicrobium sp.]
MSERVDAAVIGGGVAGLAAAALLAKAGLRTLLFEQTASVAGVAAEPALRALDPRLVKDLKLARHGLKFTARDLALTFLRAGAQPVSLVRDRHATARSLAALSPADASAFARFHRQRLDLARALRPIWWDGRPGSETRGALGPVQRDLFDRLSVTSAACWLASLFESDALKAALAFDAAAAGFAPSEAGSALALLWDRGTGDVRPPGRRRASRRRRRRRGAGARPRRRGCRCDAACRRHGGAPSGRPRRRARRRTRRRRADRKRRWCSPP